jgi:hypothetical protein
VRLKLSFKCYVCALLFIFSGGVLAESSVNGLNVPAIKTETPYGKVREIMLEHGWRPYHGANALPCAPEDERCKGRPEMQVCSDVGLGQCSWLWKKNGKIVVIKTQDDDLFYGVTRYYGR